MTALPIAPDANVASASETKTATGARVDSIDALRGFVMILMAIDHVRDFIGPQVPFHGIDVQKTGAALFFTRFITHYCAPVFVLLAGTGAFLQAARGKSRSELSRFLLTRGLWLVLLEVTVIRLGWTFDPFYHFSALQVIWAIGCSMIALAGLVYLPKRAIFAVGMGMILLHNLFDGIDPKSLGSLGFVWSILHSPGFYTPLPGHNVFVVYPLVPWIGVMAVGYSFGALLEGTIEERRRRLLRIGAAVTLAFFVVRGLNVYGDPSPRAPQSDLFWSALSFLNCTKYPPSLSYLLMTLGPAILGLAALEGRDYPGKRALLAFGRAPLLYYILHLYLAHAAAGILYLAYYGPVVLGWMNGPGGVPKDAHFGLPVVYAMTAVVVAVLYPVCRWFADLKRRRRDLAWLSYL